MMEILYKKKVIRDFLSIYNDNYWTQLISHLLEYGIILFKKKYTISALSPEDIFQIVENFKKEEKIYDKRTVKKPAFRNNSKSPQNKSGLKSRENSLSKQTSLLNHSDRDNSSKNFSSSINKKSTTNISIRSQTPNKKKDAMFKFKSNNFSSTNNITNNSKKKLTSSNSSKKKMISERPKSKSKPNLNNSKVTIKKNISNITTGKMNNLSHISSYSHTDIAKMTNMSIREANNSYIATSKNKSNISINTNANININTTPSFYIDNSNSNLEKDNKLINFQNDNNAQSKQNKKPKAESKIKALIEKDKQKYLQEKYSNLASTLNKNNNPLVTTLPLSFPSEHISQNTNNNIPTYSKLKNDDNAESNENDFNNFPRKNEPSIISLEDKLNGLTMKLSKLNATMNNNNVTGNTNQMFSTIYSSYLQKKFNNSSSLIGNNNHVIGTNENNHDEDYLGEEHINLGQGGIQGANEIEDNNEMRYYRKENDEE